MPKVSEIPGAPGFQMLNLFFFSFFFPFSFVALGKKVKLSLAAEEVAVFFAQMLDHEYTTKKVFRENFFKDWRKV